MLLFEDREDVRPRQNFIIENSRLHTFVLIEKINLWKLTHYTWVLTFFTKLSVFFQGFCRRVGDNRFSGFTDVFLNLVILHSTELKWAYPDFSNSVILLTFFNNEQGVFMLSNTWVLELNGNDTMSAMLFPPLLDSLWLFAFILFFFDQWEVSF